jgi:hypothetical protein
MSDEFGFGNPEVVEEEGDILLIGDGMACCGAAFEITKWVNETRKQSVDLKVKLVDKAAMDRSGALSPRRMPSTNKSCSEGCRPRQPTADAFPAEVPAMRPNTAPAIKPVPPG